jgi:hypothetical protein
LKTTFDKLDNRLAYAITGWLTRSKNSFFLGSNLSFEHEWRFLSNNIPLNESDVKYFYRFKINLNGTFSIKYFSGKHTKSDFFNELDDLKADHELNYFKEHFSPEIENGRNTALLISLLRYWDMVEKKLAMPATLFNNFKDMTYPLDDEAIADITAWKEDAIKKKETSFDLIFVPASFQSIFDETNFFYEIKQHKFLYSKFNENKILNGHSKATIEYIFSELENVDPSLNFDQEVSYFDIFTLLNDTHQNQFLDFILLLYERFPEDQEIKFYQFLIQLFEIINNYYFRLIIAQQEYVFNQIYLYHSKKRTMTLLDTVNNMVQRIKDTGKDHLYFYNTLCDLKILIKFKDILELYNLDAVDEEYVFRILNFSADSPQEFDAFCDIADLLNRLHSKTPLNEYVNFALYNIRQHCEKNSVKFTRKINNFFEGYLNDLFDVQPSARKTRKYLNKFYQQDLHNFLNKDRVFVSKLFDIFDVLKFEKLKGNLPENIFSNVLKKR